MSAIELLGRLVAIADNVSAADDRTSISSDTIRMLRKEVSDARQSFSETRLLIDYEATCLIECIAEWSYARDEGDKQRADRAVMYINTLRTFMRIDLQKAEKLAGAA